MTTRDFCNLLREFLSPTNGELDAPPDEQEVLSAKYNRQDRQKIADYIEKGLARTRSEALRRALRSGHEVDMLRGADPDADLQRSIHLVAKVPQRLLDQRRSLDQMVNTIIAAVRTVERDGMVDSKANAGQLLAEYRQSLDYLPSAYPRARSYAEYQLALEFGPGPEVEMPAPARRPATAEGVMRRTASLNPRHATIETDPAEIAQTERRNELDYLWNTGQTEAFEALAEEDTRIRTERRMREEGDHGWKH